MGALNTMLPDVVQLICSTAQLIMHHYQLWVGSDAGRWRFKVPARVGSSPLQALKPLEHLNMVRYSDRSFSFTVFSHRSCWCKDFVAFGYWCALCKERWDGGSRAPKHIQADRYKHTCTRAISYGSISWICLIPLTLHKCTHRFNPSKIVQRHD